jgi:hypothetical protein
MYYRFVFIFTFVSLVYPNNNPWCDSDIFALINMAFFALTNGWATSANMILAP